MRILIAEDERITRASLQRQLQAWGHDVIAAEDGQLAWESFAANHHPDFDIVITDWEMPRLSGLELVGRIRQARREAYTYVILLTSRSDKADVVSGIEAGADDFISKPFDREELRVRLLAGERVVRLERALSLQNSELRDANERIHSGLRAAARVQRSMLPQYDIRTPAVRATWTYVPTEELAGDAIGLHLIDDRYLVAYVLDVSGHGVPAALLSVAAMHALDPEPFETSLLRDMTSTDPELGSVRRPGRVLTELNRRFRAQGTDRRFFTMVLCLLDVRKCRMHIACAGHPAPILIRSGDVLPIPEVGGVPIAIVDGEEYQDIQIDLRPGDRMCLYSDGIIEQFSSAGEQFGTDRLCDALASRRSEPADRLTELVVDDLASWAGSRAFDDDVTCVLLECLNPDVERRH